MKSDGTLMIHCLPILEPSTWFPKLGKSPGHSDIVLTMPKQAWKETVSLTNDLAA